MSDKQITNYERKVLRDAINSLLSMSEGLDDDGLSNEAIKADRALKRIDARQADQQEAEPVAWRRAKLGTEDGWRYTELPPTEEVAWQPLYTTHQKAKPAVPERARNIVEAVCAEITRRS